MAWDGHDQDARAPELSGPSHTAITTSTTASVESLSAAIEYFIDSLAGKSAQTRTAYYGDLLRFKLYLVLWRPHTLIRGDDTLREELRRELILSHGKLVDTRFQVRHSRIPLRSRSLLDQFDCALSRLTREDVVGYLAHLESDRHVSRNTLCRRLASLRTFVRFLRREGFPVSVAVADKLDDLHIRRERKLPLALSVEEVRAFLSVVDNPRDRAIIMVMLFMGLRISEVIRLNIDDITEQTEELLFRGKGAKERTVPVHPQVKRAIAAYRGVRIDAPADQLGVPLFVSRLGRRIDASTVRRAIKRYAQLAQPALDGQTRRRLSPHKFRHTFATMLLQGQVDIRLVQELLGHENLSTTQIYTAVQRTDLARAVRRHPLGDAEF